MKCLPILIATIVAGATWSIAAVAGGGHNHAESAVGLPTMGIDSTEGEITRIDKDAGRVFIKHGDMRKIGLLAMLMVFDVRDAALLERVRVGDTVRFTAERNGAQLTLTHLDPIQ